MGEYKNPLTWPPRVPHVLGLEDRALGRQRWRIKPSYMAAHRTRLHPAFLHWGKTRLFKDRRSPNDDIPPTPAAARPLNNALSAHELAWAGRAVGGWNRAAQDNYLYILCSGEFYFLLSGPSNRYRSCQNIKSPDNKNTLQTRSCGIAVQRAWAHRGLRVRPVPAPSPGPR